MYINRHYKAIVHELPRKKARSTPQLDQLREALRACVIDGKVFKCYHEQGSLEAFEILKEKKSLCVIEER